MAATFKVMEAEGANGSVKVLAPLGTAACEGMAKLKPNDEILCEVKRHRNVQFHRKYFAILKEVFDNQEQFKSINDLREATLIEIGETEMRECFDESRYKVAKSMNFGSMSQAEFERVYSASLDVWAEHFGIDASAFEKEALRKEGIVA